MKKTAKEAARQRKIYMILIIILIIVLTVLGGGYYFMMQTKAASQKTSGKNSDDQSRTSQTSGSDTVEYKGGTYRYNDHLSNYLFLGIDTRNSVDTYQTQEDAGQADAIFVVSMDRATEEIKVLFIPRDSMTEIEVFNPSGKSLGESTDHINIQYAFGDGKQKSCELMKTAVSNLLRGLPIQGYYSMNISGISEVGKLVGDVEIVVPDDSLEEHDPYFKEGATVIINGDNAEEFLRYRDTGKSQSALVRQERQKTYLKALIPKLQEKMQTDSSFVGRLLDDIQPYTVTNMGNDVFAKLLNAAGNSTLETQTVPGEGVEGKYYDEYHVNEDELYRLILSMFYHKI